MMEQLIPGAYFQLWSLQINMNPQQSARTDGVFLHPCVEKMNTYKNIWKKMCSNRLKKISHSVISSSLGPL